MDSAFWKTSFTSFMLQSDFPRASILNDPEILESSIKHSREPITPPSFVIVDPADARPLAVIDVVEAIDDETLRDVAISTRGYASRLAGKAIQGFVIRVDIHAQQESDKVRFYRIWPASSLQRLTSKTFPDLDTLRVSRKLADARTAEVSKQKPAAIPVLETRVAVDQQKSKTESPGFGCCIFRASYC